MINKVKTLSRTECSEAMSAWIDSKGETMPFVDTDYVVIRNDLDKMYRKAYDSWKIEYGRKEYYVDVVFGLKLFEYLNNQDWFNLRVASNVDFWRYLSVAVLPHIVSERWGFDNEDHFWKKPMRIWLRSLWWFVYYSWSGSALETESVLLKPMFSTDTVLNIIERSGRKGTNIELYRDILKSYSELDLNIIDEFKNRGIKETDLFRAVMKLNTAKIIVTEPNLCANGVHGYVKMLFKDLNVVIN